MSGVKRSKAPRSPKRIAHNRARHIGAIFLKKDKHCRQSCGRSYLEVVVRAREAKKVKDAPDIRGDIANEVSKHIANGMRVPDIRKIGGMA